MKKKKNAEVALWLLTQLYPKRLIWKDGWKVTKCIAASAVFVVVVVGGSQAT